MSFIKIQHYRQNCIGCNACVQIAPQTWEMSAKDGKAKLKQGQAKGEVYTGEIAADELEVHQQAADYCPTKIIKILNAKR